MVQNPVTYPFDPSVRVTWFDAVGLVLGWIGLLDDSLAVMCVSAFLFAVALGQIWLKWRMWREDPWA